LLSTSGPIPSLMRSTTGPRRRIMRPSGRCNWMPSEALLLRQATKWVRPYASPSWPHSSRCYRIRKKIREWPPPDVWAPSYVTYPPTSWKPWTTTA
jgi:hypothetical protein